MIGVAAVINVAADSTVSRVVTRTVSHQRNETRELVLNCRFWPYETRDVSAKLVNGRHLTVVAHREEHGFTSTSSCRSVIPRNSNLDDIQCKVINRNGTLHVRVLVYTGDYENDQENGTRILNCKEADDSIITLVHSESVRNEASTPLPTASTLSLPTTIRSRPPMSTDNPSLAFNYTFPRYEPQDVNVTVEDGMLTIRGRHESDGFSGSRTSQVSLPNMADMDNGTCVMTRKDGILFITVEFPRKDSRRRSFSYKRRIDCQVIG